MLIGDNSVLALGDAAPLFKDELTGAHFGFIFYRNYSPSGVPPSLTGCTFFLAGSLWLSGADYLAPPWLVNEIVDLMHDLLLTVSSETPLARCLLWFRIVGVSYSWICFSMIEALGTILCDALGSSINIDLIFVSCFLFFLGVLVWLTLIHFDDSSVLRLHFES